MVRQSMKPGKDTQDGPAGLNHLSREKSPYLQQHARNPVDWYPWGEEAFGRAVQLNRPVFLSIGYAACHWCHVMAGESFEDPAIARILNNHFVAVKVDREERPDIDSVYMSACQQMTGQGGWPLTIIMTSEKKPFFAGTYLPKTGQGGMIGLDGLLQKVVKIWQERPGDLIDAADRVAASLHDPSVPPGSGRPDAMLLTEGFSGLERSFDTVHGGFGRAPKFPVPACITFLLRYGKRAGPGSALAMAEKTLDALRSGGIHDHVGGGFHRYATDAAWRVPHFEKMLYDQALLLMAYTEGWQATRRPVYAATARSIATYVLEILQAPDGTFFAAEDADSEGGEGAFYLWTRQEILGLLGPEKGADLAAAFDMTDAGNFSPDEQGRGRTVLHMRDHRADSPGMPEEIRTVLHAARNARPRPRRDTKILADWNAMMAAALAQASRVFDEPAWYRAADTAVQFILERLRSPDGGLLHRYCDGEAAIDAFCDDYAWTIRALLELYETGSGAHRLTRAIDLVRYTDRHFSDTVSGGYFTVRDDSRDIFVRKKEIYDGAIPSANAVMLGNLVRLFHLTGNPEYRKSAIVLINGFFGTVQQNPSGHCAFLQGLDHLLGPATDIVIVGDRADPVVSDMVSRVRRVYMPLSTVHVITSEKEAADLAGPAPFTASMRTRDRNAAAYVCHGARCHEPVHDADTLARLLENLPKETGPSEVF